MYNLRVVPNVTLKIPQGRLSKAEFGNFVQKVQKAFERLNLSTVPIEEISKQRRFPAYGVREDVVEVEFVGKLRSEQLSSLGFE